MPIEFDFPYTQEGIPQIQILFLGPQKSGKSYACSYFVPLLQVPQDRIIVIGPESAKFLSEQLHAPWIKVSTTDKNEQEDVFRKIYNEPKHQLLVIDEFDQIMSPGGRSYGAKSINDIVNTGRSLGKSYIGIGHGSAYVAKNSIQNADIIFFSRTSEPNLLDYARRMMRNHIDNPEYLISHLPKYKFLVWGPSEQESFMGFAWVKDGQFNTATPEETKSWSESATPVEKTSQVKTESQDSAQTVIRNTENGEKLYQSKDSVIE